MNLGRTMTRAAADPVAEAAELAFPPPGDAALLYVGEVMHARLKPAGHRFTYSVFCLLIDVDRLAEAGRTCGLFSVGRRNLVSFHETDHGMTESDGSLRGHVDRLLAPAGLDLSGGRVLLLCYPRVLGFVLNPISVYFAYDRQGQLAAAIYEVRNTFGQMHSYVCKVEDGQLSEAGLRQERDKLFYVSPFMDMAMRYRFRIRPPGEDVALRILETDDEGPILSAAFVGRRHPLTSWQVLKSCVKIPLMTVKVVAGIHWEALKLWLKGVKLVTRPEPPELASYRDPPNAANRTVTHPASRLD
jgi:hypothetical protein